MTTLELLELLRKKDVKIWAEGDQVRINSPKGSLNPEELAQIRESKEELIRLLGETARSDSRASPPIHPSLSEEPLPLSFAQERLWFFDQLQPGNPAYNISTAYSFSGDLHIIVLEQALREIVRRHEVLRTTFPLVNGRPIQKVSSDPDVVLHLEDFRHRPEQEQNEALSHFLEQEANTVFQLGIGPLWKFTLIRQDETQWVLIFVIHHIIADAWSLDIFLKELFTLYRTTIENRSSSLPDLSIQYKDFAVWQRHESQQNIWEPQLEYWKKQLMGCPMFLDLPTDHPRPAVQSFHGGRIPFSFSQNLAAAINDLSRRERATGFMTLLAAFQILLSRYSGQDDFLVGVPIAGRNRAEVAGVMGLFANTLALRVDLSGSPSFIELLGQVRRIALESFENQDLPFEQLVTALQPERTLSHSPLFQVMFAYQNFFRGDETLFEAMPDLGIAPKDLEQHTAKFDLTVFMEETSQGLTGSFEYRTDLFEEATIRRMAGHFESLLQAIVENPQKLVTSFPILTNKERHQILVEWNATDHTYPQRCLHELIEQQVKRTPTDKAVVFEDTQLTYAELNERANRLANYLRKAGVGPDVLVGIYQSRSIDMIVSILGVLKSGGAYVPLDLSTPKERLQWIVAESEMKVLLTQTHLYERLQFRLSSAGLAGSEGNAETPSDPHRGLRHPTIGPSLLCLETMTNELAQESAENLVHETNQDHLAYVIYTSGSTGKPKGVMIPHRGLVNYLSWCTEAYLVKSGIGSLVHSSIGFDMAVTSIFAPLLVGKAVHILPEEGSIDILAKALTSRRGWSFLKLTPSHLDMLAMRMPKRERRVQRLIVGGEALRGYTVKGWRSQDQDVIVVNEYGPTETVVGCCVYEVPKKGVESDSLPIGQPIWNVQLYILDHCQQPVPVGVPGELYIGGHGVARGYLNKPELTQQTFIENPFRNDPGGRLYKTGDRCRYRPDGTVEFLGRLDRQVKLRGFRIELSEVESVLATHSMVQEAVVVLSEQSGHPTLNAYIVSSALEDSRNNSEEKSFPHRSILADVLQTYLKEWLPNYMVPSSFLLIEAIPLTPNGKIDYAALPDPDSEPYQAKGSFVAPSDALEAQLVYLWEAALKVKPISVLDNFFDLGGHSLLAVRLWAKMESVLEKELPLSLLYRCPTIAQLAQAIREQGGSGQWEYLVEVQPAGGRPPLFIVPGAGGTGWYLRTLAKYLGSDQPLYGFQAQGLDGKKAFHSTIEDMANNYIAEMRRLQPEGPYYLGGHSFGGLVAFEMAQQLQHAGQHVALLVLFDTPGPAYRPPVNTTRAPQTFLARLNRHRQNVKLLNWMGVGKYVHIRVAGLFRGWWKRHFIKARRLLCYGFRMLDIQPPLILKSSYMLYVTSVEAQAIYEIRPYAGQLTLFQCDTHYAWQEGLGWKEIVWGGLDVQEVAGEHENVLDEPHVEGLAGTLQSCMEKAMKESK